MDEGFFVALMAEAITATGNKPDALAMFELQLLERQDPQLVWDLFRPVRGILLGRLYGMATYQLEQPVSEAQPSDVAESPTYYNGTASGSSSEAQPTSSSSPTPDPGTASEPHETTDRPAQSHSTQHRQRHSVVSPLRRVAPTTSRNRSPRSAASAQGVLMSIGGRRSRLDSIHDRRGNPIGSLTRGGLEIWIEEEPIYQRYAQRLIEVLPMSSRQSDIVRRFVTPDEADRWWLDLFKNDAA